MSRIAAASSLGADRRGRRARSGVPGRSELREAGRSPRARHVPRRARPRRPAASLADDELVGRVRGRAAADADPHGARAELRRAIAAARVLEAQAQLGVTRADQYPTGRRRAQAALGERPSAARDDAGAQTVGARRVSAGSAAWELDFWGSYRRATEAARARAAGDRVGTPRGRDHAWSARCASAYFELRALDLELDIAQRTLDVAAGIAAADAGARSRAARRRCSTCAQAEQLVYGASGEHRRCSSGGSRSRRTSSACCWAAIPARSRAGRA